MRAPLRNFVDQEVYACQSSLVEEALKKEFFSWDDVTNLYRPYDGKIQTDRDFCNSCGEPAESLDRETGECRECYEDNRQAQDIYEWWIVSGWLEVMLRKHGESILSNTYGNWWGRGATGQAIFLDGVIREIYDETLNS